MNIDKLSDNISARRMTTPTAISQTGARDAKSERSSKDSVDTSDWSQFISKSISEFASSNAVRTDKIRQFASQVNAPVNITGSTINTIFSRIV